jgi:predicted transposase/invertase (TIGR01784 family)
LEKGLEKGREKGREEGIRETALRLKALGMSTEVIANATGLAREAIEKL